MRKNEIRKDLNPAHYNKHGAPHDAIISVKYKHKNKANTITHAKYVKGVETLDIGKGSRVSPPFWQSEKMFEKTKKGKVPKNIMRGIRKYNKKFEE